MLLKLKLGAVQIFLQRIICQGPWGTQLIRERPEREVEAPGFFFFFPLLPKSEILILGGLLGMKYANKFL